jgi:hypothetical protein
MRPLIWKSLRSGVLLAVFLALLGAAGFLPTKTRGMVPLCEEAAAVPALVGAPCIHRRNAVMMGAAVGFVLGFIVRYRRRS